MYTTHTPTLLFKDNRLRSQVSTRASTLACTSDQFSSSRKLGPNYTLRMQIDSSLLRKGSGRGTPPLQAPSCKHLLLSKVILAPAICSYLATAFFTAFMSRRRDTKTVISSAYADTFAERQLAKGIPSRAGLASSFLSIRSRDSKARTLEETGGNPVSERFSFNCTTACRLWYIILIHLQNKSLNPAVSKTIAKNRCSILSKALDWSQLISAASVPTSSPSRTSRTKHKLSWIDIHFTA